MLHGTEVGSQNGSRRMVLVIMCCCDGPDGPSLQIFHSENQREKDERVSIQSDIFVLVSSLDFRKVLGFSAVKIPVSSFSSDRNPIRFNLRRVASQSL